MGLEYALMADLQKFWHDVAVRVTATVVGAVVLVVLGVTYWPSPWHRAAQTAQTAKELVASASVAAPKQTAAATTPNLPAFVEPPPSLRHNPDGSARDFVQLTPEVLFRLYTKKETSNEMQADINPYLTNKWVAVSGVVENVMGTTVMFTWTPDVHSPEWPVDGFLVFGKKWRSRIAFLRLGDVLSAVCRVQSLQLDALWFGDCTPFVR